MNSSASNTSKSAFRPVLVWIVSIPGAAALALILSLLDITPAWSATPDVRSVTVGYRDLDLSTPRGARVLYRRIRAAAREVCGYRGADLLEQSLWNDCYHHAIADAVGKVNNPRVTAVRTGRPPAMTAMLAKTPESAVGTSPGSGSPLPGQSRPPGRYRVAQEIGSAVSGSFGSGAVLNHVAGHALGV